MRLKIIGIVTLCLSFQANAKTVFWYKGAETSIDQRFVYVKEVLELALDKTKAEYGDYELKPSYSGVNVGRILRQMEQQKESNFFFKASITNEISKRFLAIPIPVDRGIAGYRVAFIRDGQQTRYCSPQTLASIKYKLSIVQGIGWLDGDILSENGLNVYKITSYDKMFEFISLGRVDAFFRGVNEVGTEWKIWHSKRPNLRIEPCIAFYYPLPRFFITHKNNKLNAKRIMTGLQLAYEDGSFNELWEKFFLESIELVGLHNRQIIKLNNPFISEIESSYQQYNVDLTQYLQNQPKLEQPLEK